MEVKKIIELAEADVGTAFDLSKHLGIDGRRADLLRRKLIDLYVAAYRKGLEAEK